MPTTTPHTPAAPPPPIHDLAELAPMLFAGSGLFAAIAAGFATDGPAATFTVLAVTAAIALAVLGVFARTHTRKIDD